MASAKVERLNTIPNCKRAFIALLFCADGERRYVLAPEYLNAGDALRCPVRKASIKVGNTFADSHIPVATTIHWHSNRCPAGASDARCWRVGAIDGP